MADPNSEYFKLQLAMEQNDPQEAGHHLQINDERYRQELLVHAMKYDLEHGRDDDGFYELLESAWPHTAQGYLGQLAEEALNCGGPSIVEKLMRRSLDTLSTTHDRLAYLKLSEEKAVSDVTLGVIKMLQSDQQTKLDPEQQADDS